MRKREAAAVAFFFLLGICPALGQDPEQMAKLQDKVLRFLESKGGKDTEVRGIAYDPELGLYVVKLMVVRGMEKLPVAAYITRDGRFITLGRFFALETGSDVTARHLEGLRPERVKLDQGKLRKPPFLGQGPEDLTFIGGPRCPHCRRVLPELINFVEDHPDRYSLAYVGFEPFTPKEVAEVVECLREKRPELFWSFLKELYSKAGDLSEIRTWLKDKGVQEEACSGVAYRKTPVPVNSVPVLLLPGGRMLLGSDEILEFLKKGQQE